MVLLSILLSIWLSPQQHEFHLSKCLIEYAPEESSLQVTLHVFIDDLEECLRLQGIDNLFICTEKESPEAEQYLVDYFSKTFLIEVNGQQIPFEFLGKEISEDLMGAWCYFEFKGIESIETITIANSILTEVFPDQKNIISFIDPNGKKNYFMFGKTNYSKTIDF